MAGKRGGIGRGVVAVVAGVDRAVPAPKDQDVGPFDRREVDHGDAVANGIVEAVGVGRRNLDSVVVELAPGPQLHAVIGEQIAVDAQSHGVAHSSVDRAIDEDAQWFAHWPYDPGTVRHG